MRRVPATRPTLPTPPSGCCRPRFCSMQSARPWKCRGLRRRPCRARAVQLPGARMGGDFLKVFGKPDRLLTASASGQIDHAGASVPTDHGEAVRRISRPRITGSVARSARDARSGGLNDCRYPSLVDRRRPRVRPLPRPCGTSRGPAQGLGGRRLGLDQQQGIPAPH